MAVYKPPKVLPYQQKLPQMTIPGQPPPDEKSVAPFLRGLPPQMQGTDTYQAGIDQSTAGDIGQAVGAGKMGYPMPPLQPQQAEALAAHQDYMSKLKAAEAQVNTRENDLKLSKNFLIATDPTMDKAVRKFFLNGLSQAVGVDPKGDYSKQLQGMVMGMDPPSLEALRGAFSKDIRESPPGAITQQLNGLFSGQIPLENVMARVQAHQTELAAAGAAATDPSRMAQPGTLAGGVVTAAAAPTAEVPAAPAETGALPVAPEGGGVTPLPTAPVAGQQQATPAATPPVETAAVPEAVAPPPLDDTGTSYVSPSYVPPETSASGVAPAEPAPTPTPAPTPAPSETPAPSVVSQVPAAAAAAPAAPATPTPEEAAAAAGFGPAPGSAGAGAASKPAAIAPTATPPAGVRQPVDVPGPSLTERVLGPIQGAAKSLAGIPEAVEPKEGAPIPSKGAEARPVKKEEVLSSDTKAPVEDVSGPSRLHSKIESLNEEARREPVPRTENLQPAKPEDRPEEDRPLDNSLKKYMPGLPKETVRIGDAQRLYSGASDDKEWKKDVREEGGKQHNSTFEMIDATTELNELVKAAKGEGMMGGFNPTINTPWGKFDAGKWTQGTATSMKERFKEYTGLSRMSPGEKDAAVTRSQEFAQKHLEGKSLTEEEKTILQAKLEAGYLRVASAIGIALNNNSKQFSNKDFEIGEGVAGTILSTGPQAQALLQDQMRKVLNVSNQRMATLLGEDAGVNFELMSPDVRKEIMDRHGRAGANSALPAETYKRIAEAQSNYEAKLRGEKPVTPTLERTGNREEDYTAASQREKAKESAHKEGTEIRAQEHAARERERFQTGSPADLAKEARTRAQHESDRARAEAQHQQDKIAKAFQQFAHAMAGAVKGISLPAVNLGGGDGGGGVPQFQPGQRLRPPAPLQLPLGRPTYPRLIK